MLGEQERELRELEGRMNGNGVAGGGGGVGGGNVANGTGRGGRNPREGFEVGLD